jgi:hypothetical protein
MKDLTDNGNYSLSINHNGHVEIIGYESGHNYVKIDKLYDWVIKAKAEYYKTEELKLDIYPEPDYCERKHGSLENDAECFFLDGYGCRLFPDNGKPTEVIQDEDGFIMKCQQCKDHYSKNITQ